MRARSWGVAVAVVAVGATGLVAIVGWRRDAKRSDEDATGTRASSAPGGARRTARGPSPHADVGVAGGASGPPAELVAKVNAKLARQHAATACADGPADRCVELTASWPGCFDADPAVAGAACLRGAEALARAPLLPAERKVLLMRACKSGRTEVCARSEQLDAWYWAAEKYSAAIAEGEPPPPNPAAEACAQGDVDACWTKLYWHPENQPFDFEAAWRACDGGVGQVCRDIARAAPDPATALRALARGCDLGSVATCRALHSALVGDGICCAAPVPTDPLDRHQRIPCDAPDLARAAAIAARIAELTGTPFVAAPVPPYAPGEEELDE